MGVSRNKKACVDCTKRCSTIHGASGNFSNSDASSFFKVMLDDFDQALFVPPSFAKSIEDLHGKNVFLEDSIGSLWKIRVCMKKKTLAFGTGWCKFIKDHSISFGEFLVFKQIEKSVFSVHIFSTSGSERINFCEEKKNSKSKSKEKEKGKEKEKEKVKEKENPNKRKRERTENPKSRKTLAASHKKDHTNAPSIQEVTRREEQKEKDNPNKTKRERTQNPKPRKTLATSHKKDHTNTPSIQEMTRREEQKERRTRSALRRLVMKDLEGKDLLGKDEITIIPPICAVPSEGKFLAIKDCAETEASGENFEEIGGNENEKSKNIEGEKIEEIGRNENEKGKNVEGGKIEGIGGNENEKGKSVEGEKIEEIGGNENEKGKNVEGEMNTEQVNVASHCENISSQNIASDAKTGDDSMVVKTELNQKSVTLALSAR